MKATIQEALVSNILVIEDDPYIREGVENILAMCGYDVTVAKDGEIGLAIAQDNPPNLIICDVMMPGLDGYEVLRQLRSHPQTAVIPFVFLTSKDARGEHRKGMELGADDYITKPFSADELINAVETRLVKQAEINEKYETTLSLLRKNIIYALPHELRTPLGLVLGYAEMMMIDERVSVEEMQAWSATIWRAGKRLQRGIENYLVYAQLEAAHGDHELMKAYRNHITPSVAEIISNVASKQARVADREGDLTLDLTDMAMQIPPDDLGKIITEIIDNALKFSESGSNIHIHSKRTSDSYTITIRDNGRGMSQEHERRIGALMQFERALHEQQGFGLGLAIATRLTEFHRGSIEISGEPGKGTSVEISFAV
jgi:signal transduction histidine kinase